MRYRLLFLLAVLPASTGAFRTIAMSRNICAKAGSCRDLIEACKIPSNSYFCGACKDTINISISVLSKNPVLWKGICHRLHIPADGSEVSIPSLPTGRPSRSRKKTNFFASEAPSKGKMENSENKTVKSALQLIRNNLDNYAIDRAIAERYVRIENRDKENANPTGKKASKPVTVTLPNGGKSKGSLSKQRQTLGAKINGTSMALSRDKATPTRYRAEGMADAMKRAPFIPKPAANGKSLILLVVLFIPAEFVYSGQICILTNCFTFCPFFCFYYYSKDESSSSHQREPWGFFQSATSEWLVL
jgi:hypothetical protein